MTCAGAFVVEDPLLKPYVGKLDGFQDCVEGMPMKTTSKLLEDILSK